MITFAKEKGIEVCFITMPVTKAYSDYATTPPSFDLAFSLIDKASRRNSMQYVNYFREPFENDYFFNQEHLNETEGRLISRRVEKDCFSDKDSQKALED